MSIIPIDFAPRTLRRMFSRAGPFAWVFFLAGLLLCISGALSLMELTKTRKLLDHEISAFQVRLADHEARRARSSSAVDESQAMAVNKAVMQLNLPWRDMLDAVEAATPATIALLSLEPEAQKFRMRVVAEAKSSDTMIAYIEDLKKQPFFDSVTLTRHEINTQDPNRPFRFQFEARWRENQP